MDINEHLILTICQLCAQHCAVRGQIQRLEKQQPNSACERFQFVLSHEKCSESAAHFSFFYSKVGLYFLFTSVILNVKLLPGFLVGFICPCFYFQFIMNSVFGKSLLYFAHLLFFATTVIIVMLS